MPIVSVIVPTYNRCELLVGAIQSILQQVFGDFEVIVVDDGSSDKTEAAVRSLSDSRIRYIRQDHGGRSRARNLGIMAAQGEFLSFLDDDDAYLPHKLAAQIYFLSKNPDIGLVGSGAQIVDPNGNVKKTDRPWIKQPNPSLVDCLCECRLLMCGVLCRRQALARMSQWFDPHLSLAEDLDLWIRLAQSGCRMAWLPSIVCSYRIHDTGGPMQFVGYSIACINVLDKFFQDENIPEAIRIQKDAIYAKRYLFAAMRSYTCGISAMGQNFLAAASRADPTLLEGTPAKLIHLITDYACGKLLDEQEWFIDFIFGHMPPSLAYLTQYHEAAMVEYKKRSAKESTVNDS